MRRIGTLVLLLIASSLQAQISTTGFDRVLIPVLTENPIPGAFGSQWATYLTILNTSASEVKVSPYDIGCSITCSPPPPVPPGVSFRPRVSAGLPIPGMFLLVERGRVGDVRFSLRVQDLSRQLGTWGTAFPTVPETEFSSGPMTLLNIPGGAQFRAMLRIYAADGLTPTSARVRIFRIDPDRRVPVGEDGAADALIDEILVPLTISTTIPELYPAYGQVPDLGSRFLAGDVEQIRVDVEPVNPGDRLWAFVTVTHNETQHVTVIVPR